MLPCCCAGAVDKNGIRLKVATVGMDKALRVWNFQDKSSELISFFDDAPLAVSLHPSGLYLLVSFGEKVCIYMFTKYAK